MLGAAPLGDKLMKRCKICKEVKNDDEFYRNTGKKCKSCYRKYTKEHLYKYKHLRHGYRLKMKYGITKLDYQELLNQQGGGCAICGKPESEFKYPLNVDHDHETGFVRGLLCPKCNTAIGYLNDDKELIARALNYMGHVYIPEEQ